MPETERVVKIQIKYLGAVRDATGRRADDVAFLPGTALRDVVAWLKDRYGLAVPSARVMAALMGRGWDQLAQGLATELQDGDVIALFPPIAGG